MILRPFGRTGLQVSPLCLGTMQFGWTADEEAAFAVMDAFVAAGGNFLDTADMYSSWAPGNSGGVSEEIIGRWMRARGNRDRLVVATKLRGRMWPGPDGEGLGRARVERAAEESLRRLQVDVIDLYQCHWPDDSVPVEETLEAFGRLIKAGKVRYIGLSNYSAAQLEEALRVADEQGLPRPAALQPHYNLVHRREYEAQLAALCAREHIAVIPYSPLAGGFLTGKYRDFDRLPRSQRARQVKDRHLTEEKLAVVAALDAIARTRETAVATVALAWLLTRPAVVAPIIGANSPGQLADLLPAVDLQLDPDEIATLDAVSAGL